jgi:hypothetical protein
MEFARHNPAFRAQAAASAAMPTAAMAALAADAIRTSDTTAPCGWNKVSRK